MWLFSVDGFYSAVQHKDDPNLIMVRCRAKEHADKLVQALPEAPPELVETPPPADYRWRVTITREQWVYFAARCAAEVAYYNFKNTTSKEKHPPGYMSALHGIWSDLLSVQDKPHRDTKKSRWGYYPEFTQGGQHFKSKSKGFKSTNDEDVWRHLDDWLDPADEALYTDEVEPVVLEAGMTVQLRDDEDMGNGLVMEVKGEEAVVEFSVELLDGTVEKDVMTVPLQDLWVMVPVEETEEEEVASEVFNGTSRPDPDVFTNLDELAEEDDGSWPPPLLGGPLKGR